MQPYLPLFAAILLLWHVLCSPPPSLHRLQCSNPVRRHAALLVLQPALVAPRANAHPAVRLTLRGDAALLRNKLQQQCRCNSSSGGSTSSMWCKITQQQRLQRHMRCRSLPETRHLLFLPLQGLKATVNTKTGLRQSCPHTCAALPLPRPRTSTLHACSGISSYIPHEFKEPHAPLTCCSTSRLCSNALSPRFQHQPGTPWLRASATSVSSSP
jgi:hypothetical protein